MDQAIAANAVRCFLAVDKSLAALRSCPDAAEAGVRHTDTAAHSVTAWLVQALNRAVKGDLAEAEAELQAAAHSTTAAPVMNH